ncbi:MAG: hypothetical protein R3B40_09710 [Polyangiales bacterium]|nr:hypothetical protein [Sandaracinaceae bacterium]
MSPSLTLRFSLVSALALTLSFFEPGCADSHVLGGDASIGGDGGMMMPDAEGIDIGITVDAGRICENDAPSGRPGAPAEPPAPPLNVCRTSSDCSDGTQCFGASDGFCGICQRPERECEQDSECGAGRWCRAGRPNCCGGVDTVCTPSCTSPGVGCEDGEICDAVTGRCERNGCLFLDLACPQNHDCDPERPDADASGCARRTCNVDGDCDCGFCVTGTCESQLGTCSFPPA